MALECFAEVQEVIPCGIVPDEATDHAEAGTVVGGQQQGLLASGGPPLWDLVGKPAGVRVTFRALLFEEGIRLPRSNSLGIFC